MLPSLTHTKHTKLTKISKVPACSKSRLGRARRQERIRNKSERGTEDHREGLYNSSVFTTGALALAFPAALALPGLAAPGAVPAVAAVATVPRCSSNVSR